jgi:hypothetical protein
LKGSEHQILLKIGFDQQKHQKDKKAINPTRISDRMKTSMTAVGVDEGAGIACDIYHF